MEVSIKIEDDTSNSSSQGQRSDNRHSGGGKATGRSAKKYLYDKESDEYKKRRERNNIAVRKSRDKSRQKAQETMERVNELKSENAQLEQKVTILSKELSLLKDLFLAHASELPDPSTTFGLYNSNLASSLGDGDSSAGSSGSNQEYEEEEEIDQENNSPEVIIGEQTTIVYTVPDHEYAAASRKCGQEVETEA